MYDKFQTIVDAAENYKRCRVQKSFILDDESPDLGKVKCAHCGRKLSEYAPDNEPGSADCVGDARSVSLSNAYHGNRIDYYPRKKGFVARHYTCAWSNILGAITGDVMETVENFQRSQPEPTPVG